MKYENISTTISLHGKPVKVHALCTGTVAVKKYFRSKKGWGEMAKINILLNDEYTEQLPIWVWVIEHPDGLIVIDTGEIEDIHNQKEYLAKESAFMRFFFRNSARFQVNEKDAINHQMSSIGLRVEDVKLVVLTHLHLDHTDGLKFFPKAEVIIGDYELKHPNGNMPTTYPSNFKPNPVKYQKNRIEIFDDAYSISSREDLLYVPTPGHTKGHSSVILKTDDFDIFFAGDISYNQEQVLNNELAGINADYKNAQKTYKDLMSYATQRDTIYLPSHDAQAGIRLANRDYLKC